MHHHHMEDVSAKWDRRVPNGLMLLAFAQDMVVLWIRAAQIAIYKRHHGLTEKHTIREWEVIMGKD